MKKLKITPYQKNKSNKICALKKITKETFNVFGWSSRWEIHQRVSEKDYNMEIYDIFINKNKNGLLRYKKILVNSSPVYNQNFKLLTK